jgi:twitching motility two-component system response regulator PilH
MACFLPKARRKSDALARRSAMEGRERTATMTRIAVIDDNQQTLDFVEQVFVEHGWKLLACPQGDEAFAMLQREQPDLIILDLWLERPDSGWEILRQLKSDPGTQHIPVVMCSGERERLEERRAILDEDAAAVLVKPFEVEDIERCIEYVLSRPAST